MVFILFGGGTDVSPLVFYTLLTSYDVLYPKVPPGPSGQTGPAMPVAYVRLKRNGRISRPALKLCHGKNQIPKACHPVMTISNAIMDSHNSVPNKTLTSVISILPFPGFFFSSGSSPCRVPQYPHLSPVYGAPQFWHLLLMSLPAFISRSFDATKIVIYAMSCERACDLRRSRRDLPSTLSNRLVCRSVLKIIRERRIPP